MIIKEFYKTREDGINLWKIYSNNNNKIQQNQTNIIYDEAIDIENAPYTYTEINIPIDSEEISDSEALNILLGGEEDESNENEEITSDD